MPKQCSDCGCDVQVFGDTENRKVQCEACESVTCVCGSTSFRQEAKLYCAEIICVDCGELIEANFNGTPAGVSDEAISSLFKQQVVGRLESK